MNKNSIRFQFDKVFCKFVKIYLMKKGYTFILLFFFILCFSQKPEYPQPKDGYKKVELKLPQKENEKDYKIEIFVTFMMTVTKCDTPSSTVKLEREYLLSGNRYVYYEVKNHNIETVVLISDKCKEKISKKVYNFPLNEEYESQRPYIFYIPKKMNVEYRIWKAEPKYIEVK
ncbi:hypothetical protein IX38_03555 [Chryseobacterium luteum]|uniref:Ecotin n=2 Tax=Chryseobacterium luteum TaxID=421531 RepID=A0A085ZYR6_9FLAO|nr:hypothetical protein IX38_03555 [Chryseobacterium luteum]